MLSSFPAFFNMVGSLPMARFLDTRRNPARWTFHGFLLYRLVYPLFILVPWLIPQQQRGLAVVVLLILMNVLLLPWVVGFTAIFPDLVDERDRATAFAARNAIYAAAISIATLLAGQWLSFYKGHFPANYQILIGVGFVLTMIGQNIPVQDEAVTDTVGSYHSKGSNTPGSHELSRTSTAPSQIAWQQYGVRPSTT